MQKRLTYIHRGHLPSPRANSVGVVNLCSEFASLGWQVHLVAAWKPWRGAGGAGGVRGYYGVGRDFDLTRYLVGPDRWGIRFNFRRRALRLHAGRGGLLFVRGLVWNPAEFDAGVRFICELHHPPAGGPGSVDLRKAAGLVRLVCISRAMADWAADAWGAEVARKIVVAPDGVRTEPYDEILSRRAHTPAEAPLKVGYVGSLYEGRGIETVIELAKRFPGLEFHVVGGTSRDIGRWKGRGGDRANLRFTGHRPNREMPEIICSFDCLLMPYQRRTMLRSNRVNTAEFMSPLKMFEYMASGRAIIASDLPALREVLEPDTDALMVAPGAADQWADALRRLMGDRDLARRLGQSAAAKVREAYTWKHRAQTILAGLEDIV